MSTQGWIVVAGAVALAAVVVFLFVALARVGRTARRLAERVEVLESARDSQPMPAATVEPVSTPHTSAYVITDIHLPEQTDAAEPQVHTGRIDGALFADIVVRETAVKAAGLAHGVRRALAPEVRNRIRFAVKSEVKRARKQRRADLKAALRDLQARERAIAAAEQQLRSDGEYRSGRGGEDAA